MEEGLISKHGGYRKLKSFQVAQLIYDITVRFCDKYIDKHSRTHDQMVQAARSGVQNIAEGSMASATSKKMEMKLTGIAKASLEELRLDYEDFIRQKGLTLWDRNDQRRQRLIDLRPKTADDVAKWVKEIVNEIRCGQCRQDGQVQKNKNERSESTQSTQSIQRLYAETSANAVLTLIAVASSLLDRQMKAQAKAFEQQGGFTERLYQHRIKQRRRNYESN
jgi:four helix bundle suffix protein